MTHISKLTGKIYRCEGYKEKYCKNWKRNFNKGQDYNELKKDYYGTEFGSNKAIVLDDGKGNPFYVDRSQFLLICKRSI